MIQRSKLGLKFFSPVFSTPCLSSGPVNRSDAWHIAVALPAQKGCAQTISANVLNNKVWTLLGNTADFFFAWSERKLLFQLFEVDRLSLKLAAILARTLFHLKKSISAAKNSTFRYDLTKIKFTMILSTFETIDWANKREYKNFVSVAL